MCGAAAAEKGLSLVCLPLLSPLMLLLLMKCSNAKQPLLLLLGRCCCKETGKRRHLAAGSGVPTGRREAFCWAGPPEREKVRELSFAYKRGIVSEPSQ